MKTGSRKSQESSKKNLMKKVSLVTSQFHDLFMDSKKMFKLGRFDLALLEKVKKLHEIIDANHEILRSRDEIYCLKAKAFICEVYDCFGLIKESQQITKDGEEIFKSLPQKIEKTITLDERMQIRERIRFSLSWAIAYYYRTRKHKDAEERVTFIYDLVKQLRNDSFPCNGTMGQLSYYRGKIYRQLGRLEDANTEFENAILYYYSRGIQKKKEFADKPEQADIELRFIIHRSAICLGLGLGWVNYTRAGLRTSLRNNIIPARMMLLNTGDELNRAALDTLRGAIIRSLANKDKIRSSIKYIRDAYEVFKDYSHHRYIAWAAYNLSLSFFYDGDLKAAKYHAQETVKIAKELGDMQWELKGIVLHSRILDNLKDHQTAEESLTQALKLSREYKLLLTEIDALIWRGATRINMRKFAEARTDLQKAIELNKERQDARRTTETANPRIKSLCNLHLARSFTLEHEPFKAKQEFQKWEDIKKEVEDRRVHDLADQVWDGINELKSDFVIEKVDSNSPGFQREKMTPENSSLQNFLNYKVNCQNLQEFLVDQAKTISEDKQDIAKLLGISRQTLFEWENKRKERERVKVYT